MKKKPLVVVLSITLLIITVVVSYLFFKFQFYEDKVIAEIKQYNQAVELFNKKFETLDSNTKNKYKDLNYVFLSEKNVYSDDFGSDYESYIKWIKGKSVEVANTLQQLQMFKKSGKSSDSNFVNINMNAPISTRDTTLDEDLFYSTDDIHDIYKEKAESLRKQIKVKKKSKK